MKSPKVQKVMSIHLSNGATVVTPNSFAMSARIARLKSELRANKNSTFKRWGA